jgi:hypothetical protein
MSYATSQKNEADEKAPPTPNQDLSSQGEQEKKPTIIS